jgi:hypothetical protein
MSRAVTIARRASPSSSEVRPSLSARGIIGNTPAAVYTVAALCAAARSRAPPGGVNTLTSAMPTSTRVKPSWRSAYSTWSRSRELALSMEFHGRSVRSRPSVAAGSAGGTAGSSWSNPRAVMAATAMR